MAAATINAAKSVKAFENGYREGGSYWTIIEVLKQLGAKEKFVAADKLIELYPKVAGAAALKAFRSKEKRNEETAKDWKGKVVVNAIVTTRPDYGAACRAKGYEVRKNRTDAGYEFGLFAIKPTKAASSKVTAAKIVKAPKVAKVAAKAQKRSQPKAKASK